MTNVVDELEDDGPADDGPLDGRVARRERNINAVLDVVLQMFAEEDLFPTIEQAATRSGLSLRSVYRYFADPGELLEAAIKRNNELAEGVGHLPAIGQGPLASRIDDFVAMRLRLHESIGAVYRATVANSGRLPRIRDELADNRNKMREQLELQFAPELSRRKPAESSHMLDCADLVTQLDSIEYLRRHRGLSASETEATLRATLHLLLA